MTWTNIGYPGTVGPVQDAQRSPHIGTMVPVVVGAAGSFLVTANTTADRTVNIAPGSASGCGVYTTQSAQTSVQFASIGSGTRWDALVLRRDWTNNTSSLLPITNSLATVKTVPNGLENSPGVRHDQLLALVQIITGQTVPVVDDKRARASKEITVRDLLSIPFPELGMIANVNGVRYSYKIDSGGSPAWVSLTAPVTELTAGLLTSGSGWSTTGLSNRALVDGVTGDVQLDLESSRIGGTLTAASSGNLPNSLVATTIASLRPDKRIPVPLQYASGTDFTFLGGWGELGTDGQLLLQQGSPNVDLRNRAGDISLRMHIQFRRKL